MCILFVRFFNQIYRNNPNWKTSWYSLKDKMGILGNNKSRFISPQISAIPHRDFDTLTKAGGFSHTWKAPPVEKFEQLFGAKYIRVSCMISFTDEVVNDLSLQSKFCFCQCVVKVIIVILLCLFTSLHVLRTIRSINLIYLPIVILHLQVFLLLNGPL